MRKITKEQKLYAEAMEHALKVAKTSGIDELEREVRYRQSNPVPLNVSRYELIAVAREYSKAELMFVATAMATTLTDKIKMPPMVIKEFLRHFNDLVDVYRADQEQFKLDQEKLDRNMILNDVCKNFVQEDENDDE